MKKIVGAISCVLLLMVVLVCATACKKEPDPIVSVPDKIIEFNNNLHNNWSKTRPVTVKNEIVIKPHILIGEDFNILLSPTDSQKLKNS